MDGYCRWLTNQPGEDPWFNFNGGGEGMVYSGERFGMEKPIPSIRLKLERNIIQDVAILKIAETRLKDAQARGWMPAAEQPDTQEWWNPEPARLHTPAPYWDGAFWEGTTRPSVIQRNKLDPNWWLGVRGAAIEGAQRRYEPDKEAAHHGAAAPAQTQLQEVPHAK